MIPIFAHYTLQHIIFITFRIGIRSRTDTVNPIEILIVLIFSIGSGFQLKSATRVGQSKKYNFVQNIQEVSGRRAITFSRLHCLPSNLVLPQSHLKCRFVYSSTSSWPSWQWKLHAKQTAARILLEQHVLHAYSACLMYPCEQNRPKGANELGKSVSPAANRDTLAGKRVESDLVTLL